MREYRDYFETEGNPSSNVDTSVTTETNYDHGRCPQDGRPCDDLIWRCHGCPTSIGAAMGRIIDTEKGM